MATQVKTDLIANNAITDAKIANVAITGVTASSGDSSTALATTAFVAGEINSLIDSAPGALNTLNELAAAMGDDANFSTTITNSIATKLPLAGGTLTGNLKVDASFTVNGNVDTSASLGEVLQLSQTDGAGAFLWSVDRSNNSYKTMNYHAGSHKFYTDASNLVLTLSPTNNSASFAGRIQPNDHIIFQTGTSYIQFPAAGSRAWAVASGGGTAAPGTNSATFGFHHWSGSAWSNPINITASGKLGVGTDNPNRPLSVVQNTTITAGFNDISEFLDTTIGAGGSVSLNVGRANSTKNLGKMAFKYAGSGSNSNALNFGFYDADNLMTLTAAGNVGIGNTNPAAGKLVITASSNGGFGGSLILENSNASDTDKVAIALRPNGSATTALGSYGEVRIIGEYDSGSTNGASNLQFHTHSGNGTVTERMRITSDGKVGIGGTPTNLLQVFGGASDSRIQFTNTATGNGYADGLWVGIDGTQGYLLHRENTPLSFFTNATKKMTLDTNGDLTLSDNAVVTAIDQFQNLYITSTTGSNAGWSITTNSGTFNDRGSIEVAGISNRHVFKWGFSGNLSANTWYQFAKRSELATYGPDSGGGSEDGFAMYFRIYTYTSSSGWGEYLSNRLTNMVWVGNYGSNSVQEHEFAVGPGLGHAPNGGHNVDTPTSNPIRMKIHHRAGVNDHPNSDQTFEIRVSSALTGLNPTVAGRQLLIYGYVL